MSDETSAEERARVVLDAERDARIVALLDELGELCHAIAQDKGFYERGHAPTFGEAIAEIHEEVSEALRAHREVPRLPIWYKVDARGVSKPEGTAVELADVLIRTVSLARQRGLPVAEALVEKLRYNRTRPHRHGRG